MSRRRDPIAHKALWNYTALDKNTVEYQCKHSLRQLWDQFRTCKLPETDDWIFRHDALEWPAHLYLQTWDKETDATTRSSSPEHHPPNEISPPPDFNDGEGDGSDFFSCEGSIGSNGGFSFDARDEEDFAAGPSGTAAGVAGDLPVTSPANRLAWTDSSATTTSTIRKGMAVFSKKTSDDPRCASHPMNPGVPFRAAMTDEEFRDALARAGDAGYRTSNPFNIRCRSRWASSGISDVPPKGHQAAKSDGEDGIDDDGLIRFSSRGSAKTPASAGKFSEQRQGPWLSRRTGQSKFQEGKDSKSDGEEDDDSLSSTPWKAKRPGVPLFASRFTEKPPLEFYDDNNEPLSPVKPKEPQAANSNEGEPEAKQQKEDIAKPEPEPFDEDKQRKQDIDDCLYCNNTPGCEACVGE